MASKDGRFGYVESGPIRKLSLVRPRDGEYLADVYRFSLYLVNFGDALGIEFVGHSWTERVPMGCLVVRARIKDKRYVAFCNAHGFLEAAAGFVRRLEADVVDWREDKYA